MGSHSGGSENEFLIDHLRIYINISTRHYVYIYLFLKKVYSKRSSMFFKNHLVSFPTDLYLLTVRTRGSSSHALILLNKASKLRLACVAHAVPNILTDDYKNASLRSKLNIVARWEMCCWGEVETVGFTGFLLAQNHLASLISVFSLS